MTDEPGDGDAQQHAHHAAGAGEQHGFHEELRDDVPAFGAQRAADADFARALGHTGEHDVHDADAAHEQGNGGYRAEHDIENLFGPLGALEQFQRHNDAIVLLFMVSFHDLLDGVGDGGNLFRGGDLNRDLVELHSFLLEAAAAHFAEDFAITGLGGLQRYEHAVGGGTGVVLGVVRLDAFAGRLHHADDFIVIAADADLFAQWRIERK